MRSFFWVSSIIIFIGNYIIGYACQRRDYEPDEAAFLAAIWAVCALVLWWVFLIAVYGVMVIVNGNR